MSPNDRDTRSMALGRLIAIAAGTTAIVVAVAIGWVPSNNRATAPGAEKP